MADALLPDLHIATNAVLPALRLMAPVSTIASSEPTSAARGAASAIWLDALAHHAQHFGHYPIGGGLAVGQPRRLDDFLEIIRKVALLSENVGLVLRKTEVAQVAGAARGGQLRNRGADLIDLFA